jgi:6-phosphogluconolactonase/glucosamine-6-phosphate isomerase/deaminase
MREHLIDRARIETFHLLDVDANPHEAAARVGRELAKDPIDVSFVGIGENGHLAFNDPPADFDATEPYLIVELDEACRASSRSVRGGSRMWMRCRGEPCRCRSSKSWRATRSS